MTTPSTASLTTIAPSSYKGWGRRAGSSRTSRRRRRLTSPVASGRPPGGCWKSSREAPLSDVRRASNPDGPHLLDRPSEQGPVARKGLQGLFPAADTTPLHRRLYRGFALCEEPRDRRELWPRPPCVPQRRRHTYGPDDPRRHPGRTECRDRLPQGRVRGGGELL